MGNLSKEQLEEVKGKLMKQLENLPKEQKAEMEAQIAEMNDDQLEEFLMKNKLISTENVQSPFRSIIEGKLPSYKIAENPLAMAVLELNPISKGHTIIISKKPTKAADIPEDISRFAQLIASHLSQKLGCKDIQIGTTEIFDEAIINVLPIYDNETFDSKREKISENELKKLQEELFLPPLEDPNARPEAPVQVVEGEPKEKEPEVIKEPEKKKRKTPINRLPKAPKRIP